jgi:hypothetical protein
MSVSLSQQIINLRKEKQILKAKLADSELYISRLQNIINGDILCDWSPPGKPNSIGGDFRWTWPLYEFLNSEVNASIRNRACDIMLTVLRQFIAKTGFGIDLPNEVMGLDFVQSEKRKKQVRTKIYEPCAICGFERITAECHIIPRCYGGPDNIDNFIYLCPNHHHLFDKHRLTSEEFNLLLDYIKSNKSKSAYIFTANVHSRENGFAPAIGPRKFREQGPFLS